MLAGFLVYQIADIIADMDQIIGHCFSFGYWLGLSNYITVYFFVCSQCSMIDIVRVTALTNVFSSKFQ
jgi:hypothetical protein